MKILLIGFLVFSGWTALSTYVYVCKIKGLCYDPITIQTNTDKPVNVISADTLSRASVNEQTIPKRLIIYFPFDKYGFNYNTETDKYFDKSNTYLNQNPLARISITGHTDAVGTHEYNKALGFRRAQSMRQYFENKGLPVNKMIIASSGEREPANTNNTRAGRAKNRSAVITIIN